MFLSVLKFQLSLQCLKGITSLLKQIFSAFSGPIIAAAKNVSADAIAKRKGQVTASGSTSAGKAD